MFERHYQGRFSCATFPADLRRKCVENPRNVVTSPTAQEAATEYARENLALIKIFIRLVVIVKRKRYRVNQLVILRLRNVDLKKYTFGCCVSIIIVNISYTATESILFKNDTFYL